MQSQNKKGMAVVAVCLLLPLLFIAYYTFQYFNGSTDYQKVSSVTVTTPDGNSVTYTDTNDITFYTNILEHSSVISTAIRDLTDETATIVSYDDVNYSFYPSKTVSGCMIVGPDKKIRLMTDEDATNLIIRDEMTFLYKDNLLPQLTIYSGELSYPVLPDSYTWNYKKANGSFYEDTTTEKKRETVTYNILSDYTNSFSFSLEPSQYSITIYRMENGSEGTEVPVTTLESLHFTQDTLLSITLTAKWSQADSTSCYGESTYRFMVLYDVPATIELYGADANSTLSTSAGSWIVLKANYTNENEALDIRTNCYTDNTKFYYDTTTQCSYAVVAITPDNPAGEYYISVTSGETTTLFNLDLKSPEASNILSVQVSDEDYNSYLTPELMTDLEEELHNIRATATGTLKLSDTDAYGMFVFGIPCSGTVSYDFGTSVLIANSNDNDPGFRVLNGQLYTAEEGSDVNAAQTGTVIFAGELGAAGNVVVIDHGCGVCTYYFHLDEITVSVGSRVLFGRKIGTVGSTGYTDGKPALHFALSVGETYVQP